MSHSRWGALVLPITASFLFVGLTGCTQAKPVVEDESGALFSSALIEAKEGGASDAQLTALEEAAQTQEVSVEMAREAARRSVSCLSDAGLDAQYSETTLGNGLVIPGYVVSQPDGDETTEIDSQIEACHIRESLWIDKLFQTQASSIQQNEDYANEQEPVLRACLEEKGISTDPDANGVDLANQAVASEDGSACLTEAGIDVW